MSQATLVHLCRLAALKCNTAPQHHVRLVHFLTDQLCGWQPTPLAKWLMQHIHYTFVETSVDWMSSEQHSYGHLLQVNLPRGTWYAHSLAVAYADFRPQHVRWKLPFRLASWMQSIGSKFDLGFVLDLLHLDDHEFSRQVVTRLSRSQDRTSTVLSSAQVKDLVLDNMVITLGARQTVEWLSTIARRLLRPLPLKALTVLTHAFLPQLTYEGETAIASQPFVSRASLDGMEVTATAIACGHEFLHEFWFQFPSPRAPIAFWIPGYDTTYSADQWYEQSWSSVQLNLDEGTVLAFICRCSSDRPVIPSHSFSGEKVSQPEHSSHRHPEGSTEATGPLSLTAADTIACDVGYFVFCGLVGSKDRPKKGPKLHAGLVSHPNQRVASHATAWG